MMERQRKRELRDLNTQAWEGQADLFPVSASLDSSMKKNTAFIRRLRAPIGTASLPQVIQEVRSLSLHKYLSEIISACYEGLTKLKVPAEIAAGVEVFSALHQRFGPDEFTRYVGWHIGRGLSTPDKSQLKTLTPELKEKEEKERLVRHKVLLRVATELWLVHGLRSLDDVSRPEDVQKSRDNAKPLGTHAKGHSSATDDAPFPLEALKDILGQDTQHLNLSMIAQYAKTFSWDLLGSKDEDTEATASAAPQDTYLVDENLQQRFKNCLIQYFEGAKTHLVREQANLNNQSRRNAEAYVRSGEVFEDRQANYEKMVKAHDKFVSGMQTLAQVLATEMPDLKEHDKMEGQNERSIGLVKTGDYLRGEGEGPGIWEDEEERRFYENLIDLKDRVPGILLEDPKKKKTDTDDVVGKKAEDYPASSAPNDGKETTETASIPSDPSSMDQSTAIANKTVGAQVDALLARLPESATKDAMDQLAIDFCFVNSKASRNRLIKAVQEIPRGRSDLLPLYSRLVTTLGKSMPDITQSLVAHLDDEFRSLQRRKQKDSLTGVRTSNIRYLAELTKFGVVPEHIIFHCLKVSLDDFSRMNIEILCNLMDNCGKYLLRNPETSPRMRSFLETLQRKKSAQHISQQERMLIENAMYSVDPPERAAIHQKEHTPLDLFVRKLVYVDLNRRNVERIIKQLRKLHWEEEEVVGVLHKLLVKPVRMKYSNIHFLAIILGSLNRYHPDFTTSVIDDVIEGIIFGLELNEFKDNQRRLAEVRYLGELYVYRMVDSSVIFDTMYKIVTHGHNGWPKPDENCPIDLPDDFFRLRLICNLLETCGSFFNKGLAKKKLEFFLTFFQYYIQIKDPLPRDVEYVVQEAFLTLRPQWKFLNSLEEAGAAFAEACKDHYKNQIADRLAEHQEADEQDDDDIEEDDDDEEEEEGIGGRRTPDVEDDKSSSGDEEDAHDANSVTSPAEENEDSDAEERIVVTRPEDERDPEADAEFDRELAKMMAEGVNDSRRPDRKANLDVALPMRTKAQRDADDGLQPGSANPNTMKFSLLSKKGNKPQTRAFDLPSDSNFATALRSQREAERAEQQRIKALVLNYNDQTSQGTEEAAEGSNTSPSSNTKDVRRDNSGTGGQPSQQHRRGGSIGGGSTRKAQPGQGRRLQLSDVDW